MVSHGVSVMKPHLLILGGTSEASACAHAVATEQISAILSYAGRVKESNLNRLKCALAGLAALTEWWRICMLIRWHIIDATHPFAAQISQNAISAAKIASVRYCALTRPQWRAELQDSWHHVASVDEAARWLMRSALRVMLAIGRQKLSIFEPLRQHYFLLRLVDALTVRRILQTLIWKSRVGHFRMTLIWRYYGAARLTRLSAKNSGGTGARAKLDAARTLELDVVMIDGPAYPARTEFYAPEQVIDWVKNGA